MLFVVQTVCGILNASFCHAHLITISSGGSRGSTGSLETLDKEGEEAETKRLVSILKEKGNG